jgi:hypothetical protein
MDLLCLGKGMGKGKGGGGVGVLVFRVSDGGLERKLVLVFLFLFSCCLRWLLARTSRADTYEPSMRHGRREATKDQASQSAISFSLVLNNPRMSTNKSSHTRASYSPSPYSSCHQVNINNLLMLLMLILPLISNDRSFIVITSTSDIGVLGVVKCLTPGSARAIPPPPPNQI